MTGIASSSAPRSDTISADDDDPRLQWRPSRADRKIVEERALVLIIVVGMGLLERLHVGGKSRERRQGQGRGKEQGLHVSSMSAADFDDVDRFE